MKNDIIEEWRRSSSSGAGLPTNFRRPLPKVQKVHCPKWQIIVPIQADPNKLCMHFCARVRPWIWNLCS